MIDYMKPIGAFLENTVRPLIQEMKWFIDELEKRGLKVNEENIKCVCDHLLYCYLRSLIIHLIQAVIITGIVSYTVWKILA